MKKYVIHFTPLQAESLRETAHQRRTTISALVREAIEKSLELPHEHVQVGRQFHGPVPPNGTAAPVLAATGGDA